MTAKSYASSPNVSTTPTVVGGSLVWNLGKVKAGGKFKVSLKLVASACTTPDPLDLTGEFAFTTLAGSNRVNACLNRPLYVWKNGCPAIPKGVLGAKSDFTCTSTSCGCNGRKCSCDQSTCQCASNTL